MEDSLTPSEFTRVGEKTTTPEQIQKRMGKNEKRCVDWLHRSFDVGFVC